MMPRFKDPKVLKRAGVAATSAALALWLGSFLIWAHVVVWGPLTLDIATGQVVVGWYPQLGERRSRVRWSIPPGDTPVRWWFSRSHEAAFWWFGIPAWTPCVLLGAGTWWLWRRDAAVTRLHASACPVCHYDRKGLQPGRVCPECGSKLPSMVGTPDP